jgi:uncharacterized coiled-coil DUF342 family protein
MTSDVSRYCVECLRLTREVEALRAERDGFRNGNRDLHDECQRLRAELEARSGTILKLIERATKAESERDEWREQAEGVNKDLLDALAELDAMRVDLEVADEHVRSLLAERDAMRLVVGAAEAQRDEPCCTEEHCGVCRAVDAYRSHKQQITDSQGESDE